jgi:hypothetical protein
MNSFFFISEYMAAGLKGEVIPILNETSCHEDLGRKEIFSPKSVSSEWYKFP